jgi:hypothetical protein
MNGDYPQVGPVTARSAVRDEAVPSGKGDCFANSARNDTKADVGNHQGE